MANYDLGTARGRIEIQYDGDGMTRAQRGFQGLGQQAQGSGQTVAAVGKGMGVAGLAIAAGLGLGVKAAADFESGMSNIAAVTGASGSQMDAVRKKALQLGKDTKFSATEAAGAMEELAKAGVPLPDIINGAADAAVNLAAAGGIDLKEAAEISANAMNQFALSAREMPHVADMIAGAANASSIDVHDFGESLKQVGAVAKLVGLSFDDTAVAIALMGKAGIKGSDAGTSLKTMLMNLTPSTKKQAELMKELGIITADGSNQFFDASGKARSLAEISGVLQSALKGMTKEQKLAALQTMFGSDAIRAASILTDEGAAGFNKMAGAMKKVSAADVAKKKMDNFKGSLEQLKGSLETMGITVGRVLLPALKSIADAITKVFDVFLSLPEGVQKVIVIAATAAAGFLLLGAAVIKTVAFVQSFAAAMKVIMGLKAVGTVVAVLKGAFIALAGGIRMMSLALLTSPVGWIILGITALIAVIVLIATKTRWFQNIWNAIWKGIKAVWNAVFPALKAIWDAFWNGIKTVFGFVWKFIVAYVKTYIGIVKAVITGAINVIKNVWNFWSTYMLPVVKAFWSVVIGIIKTAWSIIQAIFAVAIAVLKPIVTVAFNAIAAVIRTTMSVISKIIGVVWKVVSGVFKAVIGFIVAYVKTQFNIMRTVITTIMNVVRKIITTVWNFIRPFVTGAVNAIRSVITSVWNAISRVTSAVWGSIRRVIDSVINAVKRIVSNGVRSVMSIFNGISRILTNVRQWFNGLRNAASGGVGSLIRYVSDIPGRILRALGRVGSLLWNAGRQIIQGLINGIKSMIGSLSGTLGSITQKIKDWKGPPEKDKILLTPSGQMIMEGLMAGIESRVPDLRRMLGDITNVDIVASARANRQTAQLAATRPNQTNTNVNAPIKVEAAKRDPHAVATELSRTLAWRLRGGLW